MVAGKREWVSAVALFACVLGCEGKSANHAGDDGTGTGGSVGTGGTSGGTAGNGGGPMGGAFDCEGYCEVLSQCRDISSEGCLNSCEYRADDNRALGCLAEYQGVVDCFASSPCESLATACSAEASTYALCASTSGSMACKTICEQEWTCGVADPECLVICGKDARLTAERGCSAEHDALLTCAMSHADPCELNLIGCQAEDEALLQCAL